MLLLVTSSSCVQTITYEVVYQTGECYGERGIGSEPEESSPLPGTVLLRCEQHGEEAGFTDTSIQLLWSAGLPDRCEHKLTHGRRPQGSRGPTRSLQPVSTDPCWAHIHPPGAMMLPSLSPCLLS